MSTGTFRQVASYSRQHWFVLGLVLFFAALSYQYSYKVQANRSAILRWQEQLLGLMDGEDIYQRYIYPNPPIMALLLYPVAKLPPAVGALTWFYLKVGMVLLALFWVFRLVERPEQPFPPWAKGLTVLLSLRPIMGDLQHGNVNLFILFLVIAALYAFCRQRDVLAGILLALGIACKVTPALFVPYFLWKRAWKTLAGCALGLGLFFWVVPAFFLGWNENTQQLGSWYEQMVKPYVLQGVVTSEHHNQSLPGLLYRLATHSPSFSTYVKDQYTPVAYHNGLDLSPDLVRWILKGCMAGFALLVIVVCRTPLNKSEIRNPKSETNRKPESQNPKPGTYADCRCISHYAVKRFVDFGFRTLNLFRISDLGFRISARRYGWRLAAEFSLVVLGMLLFSERTWKHHCVTLVLPFAVLAYCLAVNWSKRKLRWYLLGTLTAVTLLMATTSTSILQVWTSHAAKLAQVYGAYVWAYLLLIAALVVLLRQTEAVQPAANRGDPGYGEDS